MSFARGWSALRNKWYGLQLDDSDNLKVTGTIPASKTVQTTGIKAMALLAAASVDTSSVIDLSAERAATFFISHGRTAATVQSAATEYRIEVSAAASGNDTWRNLYALTPDLVACSSTTLDADAAIGAASAALGAGTFAVGETVFIYDTTPLSNSEWAKLWKVTGADATTEVFFTDVLTRAKESTTSVISNKAEQYAISLDASAIMRARVVCSNPGDQIIAWKCACTTGA